MKHTVIYITPSVQLLGARISLIEFLKVLDKARFHPIVLCPCKGQLVDSLEELGIDARVVRFGDWRKAKYWPLIPSAISNITDIARDSNAALFHSNEFWAFPYVYLASRRLKIPAICHFRCSREPSQLPPWKLKSYFVHKADRIIAVSQYQRIIFEDIPETHSKFLVIPNGVDLNRFESADKSAFRSEIGLNGSDHLIGMVGPVCEHKGVEDLIRALVLVAKQVPNFKCVIVGPERPELFGQKMHELTTQLGIADKVVFTGFRNDNTNVIASLDLLVTPSRVEAFGRVVIEAMAAGTPIIAAHVGGIPEILSSPDFGFLTPPKDAEKLADNILRLIHDPQLRAKLVQQARQHIRNNYTIQIHAQRIQEVYNSCL